MPKPLWFGLLLGLSACPETETKELETQDAPEKAEPVTVPKELKFPEPDREQPLQVALFELAGTYARNMEPHGPLRTGRLDRGGQQDFQAILEPYRCYKILAVGSAGVRDLDLVLFDPLDAPIVQDTGTDAEPVLGTAEPICPSEAGSFRARVRMFDGQGAFLMQVARTEVNPMLGQ
ncbi:MAG: hypothetical protein AAF355_05895 [Myxococcota bacterium]